MLLDTWIHNKLVILPSNFDTIISVTLIKHVKTIIKTSTGMVEIPFMLDINIIKNDTSLSKHYSDIK
jgi:hypothetical protein